MTHAEEILNNFKNEVSKLSKNIIFPEGSDERTIDAVAILCKEGLINATIIGDEEKLRNSFKNKNLSEDTLKKIFIINNLSDKKLLEEYSEIYYELRKTKGLTLSEARIAMENHLFFAAMMLHLGKVDGMVAGAENTTGNVLRSALRIVGLKSGMKTVSSCFIMVTNKKEFGQDGCLIFADCAVNIDPDANALADIAISSAESAKKLLNIEEPRVALLSFSTMGSAASESTEKVLKALETVKSNNDSLLIDGEMQLDAALIPDIAKRKAPNSDVAGKANVLIFPNLDSANIGYKLVERFADASAIGPIIQGLKKPVNDLSRGCKVEDIVNVAVITALQAR